ncbi:rRNA pseudouridine synthase [Desertifilum sp. FACHB-1129]|uniref:Pseudouridine synthase n=1 Tax=Desertifilum tharense IPPAS B-1220 TaxID=1781255 RepID=A0A1E5QPG5_9CYAN|nr:MULTISPECIES: pseudouridine synthase [Desertifilum]MDA0211001.1 pseudouridine synthase [Cyanobacteria bacterium FC1]MDI9637702.1 pseudouridine synthase [Geitlerinema splendidum]MBD2312745.1 rRNA pseudouridine synthase [Desertifilum sp. FACHB-1129]MBD2320226.1 rRNA pseudouridine synthase [Desertifilum sp. FACHB-866]MBD2330354.1 rRNA pseudouridine synthase [Desertifilum sp. FACHB-868]
MHERLHKILSRWGVASRRHAEQMILAGRVRLNGTVVEQLGQKADPERDAIEVDGTLIADKRQPQRLYLLLHKPVGVVSTCRDPQNRRTVLELLPPNLRNHQGIHPVGRLDADSSGALLLTNDGDLTFGLTHPRHSVPKTYRVWVKGSPPETVLQAWRTGVILSGRKTAPAQVKVLESKAEETLLEIILREGRNRQIRRVAEQLGYPVVHLHRIAIGSIHLRQLPTGQYRMLSQAEVQLLKQKIQSAAVKRRAGGKERNL